MGTIYEGAMPPAGRMARLFSAGTRGGRASKRTQLVAHGVRGTSAFPPP